MDPNLAFWSLALTDLWAVVFFARRAIARVRAGDVAGHKRNLLVSGLLIVGFLASYLGKVGLLGKEDRSEWGAFAYGSLYTHETCIAVMLAVGVLALWRARKFPDALRTLDDFDPRDREMTAARAAHARVGRVAVTASVLAAATATLILVGMFARA